jgi:hypothetical protein
MFEKGIHTNQSGVLITILLSLIILNVTQTISINSRNTPTFSAFARNFTDDPLKTFVKSSDALRRRYSVYVSLREYGDDLTIYAPESSTYVSNGSVHRFLLASTVSGSTIEAYANVNEIQEYVENNKVYLEKYVRSASTDVPSYRPDPDDKFLLISVWKIYALDPDVASFVVISDSSTPEVKFIDSRLLEIYPEKLQ